MQRGRRSPPFWYLRRPRRVVHDEVDEELALHLEWRARDFEARGLSPDEARREAARQFGNLDETRRYCRRLDERKENDMHRRLWLSDLSQDIRTALRGLGRAPALTATILLTVGLGIGATTIIFGAIDAALMKPLPYKDPERLAWLYVDAPPFTWRFSLVDYQALDAQQTHFERIAAFTDRSMGFSDGTSAELLRGRAVSWTYFGTLGITPTLGRDFTARDGRPGPPSVIVTHGFWQRRLGGRAEAVGKTIRLDGVDHAVVGVLPALVTPLERRQEFFVALQFGTPTRRGPFPYWVIARLRPDATAAAAGEELRAISKRLFPIWRASYQDEKAVWMLTDLKSRLVGNASTSAGLALAAVALVWLIACANASNLLIARITSRRREIALRTALGASRGRVIRHLLVESALLAAGAAAIGAALAIAGLDLLRDFAATYFPRTDEIAITGNVVLLLALLAVTSALLFGGIPAIYGTRLAPDEALHTAERATTGGPAMRRVRQLLVGSQYAIATPILVVATLLLVSLNALRHVELGFDGRNTISGAIRLPGALYREGAVDTYWRELSRRLAALPGIAGVALSDSRPPSTASNINNFNLEDAPTPAGESQPATPFVAVTPSYFEVLGVEHLEGRQFDERDALATALQSVIVDRAWARRFFPNESAVGKRFREGGCTDCPWTTVVGVVSDVKFTGLDQRNPGTVYTPMPPSLSAFVVVRSASGAQEATTAIRRVVRELDPTVPLTDVATVEELVDASLQNPRALSTLVAAFAAVAVVLSIVGIYGVMTYYVQQHAREIGIRLALGGSTRVVRGRVVRQGMGVVLLGVACGSAVAFGAARLLSNLWFGLGADDVAVVGAVTLFLVGAAFLACLFPARRAVARQPAAVLRAD